MVGLWSVMVHKLAATCTLSQSAVSSAMGKAAAASARSVFSKAFQNERSALDFSYFLVKNPVHPGNAKQVMEPATLWFERRARRVKRATSGNLMIYRP